MKLYSNPLPVHQSLIIRICVASDELPDINLLEMGPRLKKQDPSSDEDVTFLKEEKR